MYKVLIVLVLISGECAAEWWTNDRITNTLIVSDTVFVLADWAQTRNASDKQHTEAGVARNFIGERPKSGDINRYFVGSLIVRNVVGAFLPLEYKKAYYGGLAAFQLSVVHGNASVGVEMRF